MSWLPRHVPADGECPIVHRGFRINMLISHPVEPQVLAVLGWESSALGKPLADFACHCLPWHLNLSESCDMARSDPALP